MDYKNHILKAIEYVEDNLKYELDISACARASGYSTYHFLRVFKYATGLTPADYIRKRRLTEIAKCMINGNELISELAFLYGFNSKENFIRAFKSEHHVLPTEYKNAKNSLKLYERIIFENIEFSVLPIVTTLDSFELTVYKSDEDYTPNYWNKYNAKKWSGKLSGGNAVEDYGVCVWNENKNLMDYYIGIKTEDAKGNISNTQKIIINGGLYAIFATPPTTNSEFVNTIHQTWYFIFNKWLPQSIYRCTTGYQFESYIEESRTYSENIYIPIERK